MKADLGGDDFGIQAEINMIPLIDVALVLLIIFMVMTPLLVRSQIEVNLPKASASKNKPEDASRIEVAVDKNGTTYLESQPVTMEQLGREMNLRVTGDPDVSVIVSADKEVIFDRVVSVMDEAKKAGVVHIGVAVREAKSAR